VVATAKEKKLTDHVEEIKLKSLLRENRLRLLRLMTFRESIKNMMELDKVMALLLAIQRLMKLIRISINKHPCHQQKEPKLMQCRQLLPFYLMIKMQD
jgi:hypothetical protein